ncbi:hypothetical protein FGB62_138g00 [Gracilaria domingensis]|nr:hypothetical protein FGB62_138g00 [Gracilaria domingensis]
MPFRATDDPTYPPCRAFLDKKFAVPQDISAVVSETADALQNPEKLPSDRVLSDFCIRAIWPHFAPPGHPDIPKDTLDSVDKQVGGVVDSILPWRFLPAKPNIADVYEFTDESLKRTGEREALPDPGVTDMAHVMFAMNINGPPLLREVATSIDDDVDAIFTRLGLVENSIRIAKRSGTLGGLLDDNEPAEAKKTMVMCNIRSAARATRDIAYAFSSGPGTRRCAAEPAIVAYVKAVQEELKRRRTGSS